MAKVGRNQPCPCGSGKKYKQCCLPVDEQRDAERRAIADAQRDAERRAMPSPSPSVPSHFFVEDDGLDELSNSVVDLARAERFDEALAACQRLLAEFPEVVDGLERSGMVHAKMGNHALAADFYRRALAFVTDPSRRGDYESSDFYREQIEKEERLAGQR